MKGWENNVVSFSTDGNAGNCPKCGGKNVTVQEHIFETRRSLTFRCKDCGAGDHFDGFMPEVEKEKKVQN